MSGKKKTKQIMAFLLVSIFLLVMSFFTVYEDLHMIHECSGQDCPVCHELQIAESFTKLVILAVAIIASGFFFIVLYKLIGTVIQSLVSERTLILDKVRIDD